MIGLFFGSFNPIHNGHLGIARYLLQAGYCREIWFVISPCNPFKTDQSLLSESSRLQIVEEAIAGRIGMKACDIEFGMPKPSYTVDTLRLFFETYPDESFALIMGEDNVLDFHKWKDYRWIMEHCPVFVYPRLGLEMLVKPYPGMIVVDAPLFPFSATEIREKISRGEDISSLVPDMACTLILETYKNK